jgi:hypothetical protein
MRHGKLLNKIAFLCLLEFIFIVNLFKDAIMLMLKILKNSTLSLKYVLSKLNLYLYCDHDLQMR